MSTTSQKTTGSSLAGSESDEARLQEAIRLARWLSGAEAAMQERVSRQPIPAHSTLASIVCTLLENGNVAAARTKAAHLPCVDRRMPDTKAMTAAMGEAAAASFSSYDANCVRLHVILDTTPPEMA